MTASGRTARSMVLLPYLTMGLPAPLNLIYLPAHFIVPGNAAATAANIAAEPLTYRVCILAGLISSLGFIWLAARLFEFFKAIDAHQARLLVSLVLVAVALSLANSINLIAPLVLLNAKGLTALPKPQLDALALGFLRIRSSGLGLEMAFWGLWLLPFGRLVLKSRVMPKFIGVLLILNCVAWLAVSVSAILFPAEQALVDRMAMPFYSAGEISVVLWLVFRGSRVTAPLAVT